MPRRPSRTKPNNPHIQQSLEQVLGGALVGIRKLFACVMTLQLLAVVRILIFCCQGMFEGFIGGLLLFRSRDAQGSSLFLGTVASITPFVYETVNVYLFTMFSLREDNLNASYKTKRYRGK